MTDRDDTAGQHDGAVPPRGEQPHGGQAPGDQPHGGQPHGGQPHGGQPHGGQLHGEQAPPPYGQQPPQPYGQQHPYGQPMPPPTTYPQQAGGYQQPSGQPPYGQPDHGQAAHGQPAYGQPAYGQPNQGLPHGAGGGVPLWAPLYGAGPVVAVKRFFQKYADFTGRASRSEYWWVVLANAVLWFVLSIVGLVAGIPGSTTDYDGTMNPGPGFIPFGIVLAIVFFATIVPFLSLGARRLHDIGISGWLQLIQIVPYLGSFTIFILSLLGPKPSGARYDRPRA